MFNRQFKVCDALIFSVYIIISAIFLLALITSTHDWNLHLLMGYTLSALLIPIAIYSIAHLFSLFRFNRIEISATEIGVICRVLRVSTFLLIVFTSVTGMIVLAYSEQLGPLYSVIDYFPYWVFATVNELHKISAHIALLMFLITLFSYLNERFLQKLSSNHSISVTRKDH